MNEILVSMRALELIEQRCLDAALGWLELGNAVEAQMQLDEIRPESKFHPAVMKMRWHIYAFTGQWETAIKIAKHFLALFPRDFGGWMMKAESLKGLGRYQEALETLLPAINLFPREAIARYLLACYSAKVGNYTEARRWLAEATELDESSELKLHALGDPDLEIFWLNIPATPQGSRNRGLPARNTRKEYPR